ncbi:MAG: hypothetical protein ACE5OW_01875 [Candidatus Bathyarchaeia archaeon]
MRTIISLRLKKDRRGVSNIIVVVLSLVIITVIASNVILWSYQMNALDWEKIRENVIIAGVVRATYSSWFVTQSEYIVNTGSRTSGTYEDTQAVDDRYESFRESTPPRRLDLNGTFVIDLSTYPLAHIQTIEIQLRYRASDSGERWYLEAYDWTTGTYSDNGFNSTAGHAPTLEWDYYAVSLTNEWRSYVWDDGTMCVKVRDEKPDGSRTTIDIDFLGVRVMTDWAGFTFENKGPSTSHLVSLWVINSTIHQRYDISVFINPGETLSYLSTDIHIPEGQYTVKVVTERGNVAVYSGV